MYKLFLYLKHLFHQKTMLVRDRLYNLIHLRIIKEIAVIEIMAIHL